MHILRLFAVLVLLSSAAHAIGTPDELPDYDDFENPLGPGYSVDFEVDGVCTMYSSERSDHCEGFIRAFTVADVRCGSEADKKGVRIGDEVVFVHNVQMRGLTPDELMQYHRLFQQLKEVEIVFKQKRNGVEKLVWMWLPVKPMFGATGCGLPPQERDA